MHIYPGEEIVFTPTKELLQIVDDYHFLYNDVPMNYTKFIALKYGEKAKGATRYLAKFEYNNRNLMDIFDEYITD